MLTCLVRLNHERVREVQAGHIRYLRPAYQPPDTEQATLALLTAQVATTAAIAPTGP